ncbi:MAG: hypothetical protein ACYTEL_05930 [Planctomycetota bacterium]|jgi:hypothetical protein
MVKALGRILKDSEVKVEGKVCLDAVRPAPGPPPDESPAAVPTVRLVENDAEFAVIEVTCSCGSKTIVRCEYSSQTKSVEEPQ